MTCKVEGCENEQGKFLEYCTIHQGRRNGYAIPPVSAEALEKPPLRANEDGTLTPIAGWEGEQTGGVKFDAGKPRMDLLDAYAIEELSKVLTFGAAKYAPHNWRKGIVLSRLIAASCRHLFAIARGEDIDEETGLAHAAHLMCCAMFMVWTMKHLPAMDDRWKNPGLSIREIMTKAFNTLGKDDPNG